MAHECITTVIPTLSLYGAAYAFLPDVAAFSLSDSPETITVNVFVN